MTSLTINDVNKITDLERKILVSIIEHIPEVEGLSPLTEIKQPLAIVEASHDITTDGVEINKGDKILMTPSKSKTRRKKIMEDGNPGYY
jgi:hypothetical protein